MKKRTRAATAPPPRKTRCEHRRKRVAALAELADRPALAGRAAAGAIQRRKRRLADRAAGQMLFAALRDDDDGPRTLAPSAVSRRRAPFCWRKRDVAAAATAAAALENLAGDASLAGRAWADAVLARACAKRRAPPRPRSQPVSRVRRRVDGVKNDTEKNTGNTASAKSQAFSRRRRERARRALRGARRPRRARRRRARREDRPGRRSRRSARR